MSRKIILVLVACAVAGFLLYNLSSKQQGSQGETGLSQTMEAVESKGSDLLRSTKQAAEDVAKQAAAKVEEAKAEIAAVAEDAAVKMEEAKAEIDEAAGEVASKVEGVAAEMAATAAQVAGQADEAKTQIQETAAKIKELLAQAQGFIDSGKYQEAINAANFILSNLDSNSIKAKDLLSLAKTKLQEVAQEKAGDIQENVTGALSESKDLMNQ